MLFYIVDRFSQNNTVFFLKNVYSQQFYSSVFSRTFLQGVGRENSVGIAIRQGLVSPGSNSGGGEILLTRPDGKWDPLSRLFDGCHFALIRGKAIGSPVRPVSLRLNPG